MSNIDGDSADKIEPSNIRDKGEQKERKPLVSLEVGKVNDVYFYTFLGCYYP